VNEHVLKSSLTSFSILMIRKVFGLGEEGNTGILNISNERIGTEGIEAFLHASHAAPVPRVGAA